MRFCKQIRHRAPQPHRHQRTQIQGGHAAGTHPQPFVGDAGSSAQRERPHLPQRRGQDHVGHGLSAGVVQLSALSQPAGRRARLHAGASQGADDRQHHRAHAAAPVCQAHDKKSNMCNAGNPKPPFDSLGFLLFKYQIFALPKSTLLE